MAPGRATRGDGGGDGAAGGGGGRGRDARHDFLLAARAGDPPPLDRALVYRTASGALRPRMIAALREIAAGRGLTLEPAKPPLLPGFDQADFYREQLLLFDWPALTSGSSAPAPSGVAGVPCREPRRAERPLRRCCQRDRPDPRWEAVARVALVIEEPAITRESLPAVMRYLAATTDLAPGPDLLSQRGFLASFTGLIEERAGLPAVIQAFEERVLLCIDPTTNRYDDTRYRRDLIGRQGRRALLPHLRNLAALRRSATSSTCFAGSTSAGQSAAGRSTSSWLNSTR